MGQVHPMPNQSEDHAAPAADKPPATVRSIDSAHCGLCGAKLSARALRYRVVSPQCCESTHHGVPYVPQSGLERRVQAGRVSGRRPAISPPTGAHGLPFATITVPASPFHLTR